MPRIVCIPEKILDNIEQALDLDGLAQLLLRLSEQRDPRGLTHFRPSPRQKPEALFARRLAQHVFVLDENPTDAIGEADLAWFEGNQATRCVVHRVLLFYRSPITLRLAPDDNIRNLMESREYHSFS